MHNTNLVDMSQIFLSPMRSLSSANIRIKYPPFEHQSPLVRNLKYDGNQYPSIFKATLVLAETIHQVEV